MSGPDDRMNPLEPDPLSLKRLLVPAPDDALIGSPASPLVNSVKNDGPELLSPTIDSTMTTPEEMQIRNIIASPVGKANFGWICQPAVNGTPDRICGVCKKYRLKPFDTKRRICRASILRDMG